VDFTLALAGALGGAVLGAFLGSRGMAWSYRLMVRKHEREREARTLLNLFQALFAELDALWTGYATLVGEELERADKPEDLEFAGIMGAAQHYFGVYDHSARLLGTLDPASGKKLIDTYVNLKLFFDELNTFQRLSDNCQEMRLKANVNLFEARAVRQVQENFFAYLKKRHHQVKALVQESLNLLKEFISLGQQAGTSVSIKL